MHRYVSVEGEMESWSEGKEKAEENKNREADVTKLQTSSATVLRNNVWLDLYGYTGF